MVKSYKHEKIIKAFSILGGFFGFLFCFLYLFNIENLNEWIQKFGYYEIISAIVGMVIAGLTLLVVFNPNDPIPLHWLSLLIFGALLLIFTFILSGILVIISSIICMVDPKKKGE